MECVVSSVGLKLAAKNVHSRAALLHELYYICRERRGGDLIKLRWRTACGRRADGVRHRKPFALHFSLTGRDTIQVFLLKVIMQRKLPSRPFLCAPQTDYLMSAFRFLPVGAGVW